MSSTTSYILFCLLGISALSTVSHAAPTSSNISSTSSLTNSSGASSSDSSYDEGLNLFSFLPEVESAAKVATRTWGDTAKLYSVFINLSQEDATSDPRMTSADLSYIVPEDQELHIHRSLVVDQPWQSTFESGKVNWGSVFTVADLNLIDIGISWQKVRQTKYSKVWDSFEVLKHAVVTPVTYKFTRYEMGKIKICEVLAEEFTDAKCYKAPIHIGDGGGSGGNGSTITPA